MNIEEAFTKNVQWVLSEIQTELLIEDAKTVRFRFCEGDGAPIQREQVRICRWLFDLGAVKYVEDIREKLPFSLGFPFVGQLAGYVIEVDEVIFNELVSIYDVEVNTHTDHKSLLTQARKLKKVTKIKPAIKVEEQSKMPIFSKDNRQVYFNGKVCDVPAGNQLVVITALFDAPADTWIKETDVVGDFSRGDNKQSFYDAQRYLNDRIWKNLGIKNMIEYKGSSIRLNPEVIKKLGQT